MKLRRRRRVKAFPQKRSQLGGSGLPPGIWVQGFAPPSAFGRAAASPQTRQMRCWLSSERTTNPSSRRKRQDSLSLSLVLFPPKPLRWVSAGFRDFTPQRDDCSFALRGQNIPSACTPPPQPLTAHTAAHTPKHGGLSGSMVTMFSVLKYIEAGVLE